MSLDRLAIRDAGARVGVAPDVLDAVERVIERVAAAPALAAETTTLIDRLLHDAPGDALAAVRAAARPLARDEERAYFLLLALAQVPAAEARHAARGIEPAISRATLADLSVWTRHFQRQVGARGITVEILDWAQRYLRGDLLRVGSLQLDLVPFAAPLRVYREPRTCALRATDLDGLEIDLERGEATGAPADLRGLELVLAPGTPILDMHVPADSFLSLRRVGRSLHEGLERFARLVPDVRPAGVAGEAWILDPQVRALLPRNPGIHALQAACRLYPSRLPEDKTIRRLFGSDVTRADLAALPTDDMSTLQRAVLALLADPGASLRARGGFILREELETMEVFRP